MAFVLMENLFFGSSFFITNKYSNWPNCLINFLQIMMNTSIFDFCWCSNIDIEFEKLDTRAEIIDKWFNLFCPTTALGAIAYQFHWSYISLFKMCLIYIEYVRLAPITNSKEHLFTFYETLIFTSTFILSLSNRAIKSSHARNWEIFQSFPYLNTICCPSVWS